MLHRCRDNDWGYTYYIYGMTITLFFKSKSGSKLYGDNMKDAKKQIDDLINMVSSKSDYGQMGDFDQNILMSLLIMISVLKKHGLLDWDFLSCMIVPVLILLRNIMIVNGLIGEHMAAFYPVEIPLNSKEMQLAMYNEDGNIMNWCWEQMCESVMHRRYRDYRCN